MELADTVKRLKKDLAILRPVVDAAISHVHAVESAYRGSPPDGWSERRTETVLREKVRDLETLQRED